MGTQIKCKYTILLKCNGYRTHPFSSSAIGVIFPPSSGSSCCENPSAFQPYAFPGAGIASFLYSLRLGHSTRLLRLTSMPAGFCSFSLVWGGLKEVNTEIWQSFYSKLLKYGLFLKLNTKYLQEDNKLRACWFYSIYKHPVYIWAVPQQDKLYSPSWRSSALIRSQVLPLSKPAHQAHQATEPILFITIFISLSVTALICTLRSDQPSFLFLSLTKRVYLQNKHLINPFNFAALLVLCWASLQSCSLLLCVASILNMHSSSSFHPIKYIKGHTLR